MFAPKTEGAAAQRDAGGGPNYEQLRGEFDIQEIAHDGADDQALSFDPRLLGIGLNDCESALAESLPVVCHSATYARLFALGISGDAINGRGLFDSLAAEEAVLFPGGRFEFGRDSLGIPRRRSVIVPARDESGDIIDLVALSLESGRVLTWRGCAAMLGAENVFAPRLDSEALLVHENAFEWLRSGRRGIVILDATIARWRLAEERLAVANAAFGRRLQDALALPGPQIFVTCDERRAA